jgi:hypothetical protein
MLKIDAMVADMQEAIHTILVRGGDLGKLLSLTSSV